MIKRAISKHKVFLSIVVALGNAGVAVILQLITDAAVEGNGEVFSKIVIGTLWNMGR